VSESALQKNGIARTSTSVLYLSFWGLDSVRFCFRTCGPALLGAKNRKQKENLMKTLTLSFWLALAAASIIVVQNATPASSQVRTDLPIPTCPPECPDSK
jgi:hypothetical protein